jgi:hypothetical protein
MRTPLLIFILILFLLFSGKYYFDKKPSKEFEDSITEKYEVIFKEYCLKQFWKNTDTLNLDTVTVFRNSQMCYNKLPKAFFRMTHLKFVHLDTQLKLDTLADEIGQLIDLEILEITKSNLKYLPKSIGKLINLKKLTVAWGGGLTEIPPEIGNLSKLEELDLFRNRITTLPNEISKLKHLKKLILGENNFSELEKNRISGLLPKCEIQFLIHKAY